MTIDKQSQAGLGNIDNSNNEAGNLKGIEEHDEISFVSLHFNSGKYCVKMVVFITLSFNFMQYLINIDQR